ncbi:MAG: hypothetical protein Q8Q01_03310 [archaeon]|nr:hypothetical protein [archaeon]
MQKLKIFNSKEVKKLREVMIKEYGVSIKGDYAFLLNERERLFLVNKEISKVNLDNLRIDKIGLNLGEYKNNQLRLSKEGTAFFVENSDGEPTNIVDLSKEETITYFEGLDLVKDLKEEDRMIILRYENEILGSSRYKDGKILNFMPKMYRGETIL